MSLKLSNGDLNRLESTQRVLLSPLEHKYVRDWCEAVLENVEELCRADRSMVVLPCGSEVLFHGDSPESSILTAFGERINEQMSSAVCYTTRDLEQTAERPRAVDLEDWSSSASEWVNGSPRHIATMRRETVRLGRDHCSVGMNASLSVGKATLGIAYSRAKPRPFGEAGRVKLLRLLLPAFKAGVRTVLSLQKRRDSLGRVLDTIAGAVIVWDVEEREIYRSREFRRLLADDPDADHIMEEIRFLAGRLSVLRRSSRTSDSSGCASAGPREISTAAARYHLRGGYLAAGLFGRDPAIAVAAEQLTPTLPPVEDLQDRFGLTPREAEVARLLARGLSNKEAAEQFSISPHTVRSHAERIFRKLGIHTRKALGLKLLGGSG